MKKTIFVAMALALSAGSTAALADGSPELGRPFGDDFYRGRAVRNDVAVAPAPVTNDADAVAALQANGYRAIDGLARGSDGAWHATAVHGSAKVNVLVAPDGRVIAR